MEKPPWDGQFVIDGWTSYRVVALMLYDDEGLERNVVSCLMGKKVGWLLTPSRLQLLDGFGKFVQVYCSWLVRAIGRLWLLDKFEKGIMGSPQVSSMSSHLRCTSILSGSSTKPLTISAARAIVAPSITR
jgi:hypothetical protein